MKTLNSFSMLKRVALVLSMMLSVASLTACGNKGSSSNRPVDPYYSGNPNCPTCGGGQTLGYGTGESYWFGSNQIEARLSMNLYLGYSGNSATVSGDGRLDMFMPYASNCGFPQGTYQVSSQTPMTYGGVTFGGGQFMAMGPYGQAGMIIVPPGGLSLIGNRITGVAYMNYQHESCKLLVQ
ncbi:MAG: hypothetical protein V4692_10760 [Bdellovibrionota bacterium]